MHIHQIRLPSVQLSVSTHGRGLPLLLLHAFPLDHSMWAAQGPLADHLQLIVPDQRGFGGSAQLRAILNPASELFVAAPVVKSIAQLADDAVALLDALEISQPAVVCGISMGGYVAQHIAVRHPHRVRSLILVDTKLEADTPQVQAARSDLAAKVSRLGVGILAEAMIPRLLAAPVHAASDPHHLQISAALRRMIVAQPVATIVAALDALGARPDRVAAMRSVRVPTLLIGGEKDAITPPECLERAQSVIEKSRLLIVPNAGHMVPMEAPKRFNAAVLAFLQQTGGLTSEAKK